MKKRGLPITWIRWRRRRYGQLVSRDALSSDLAWRVAAAEAKGRHRISRIVGNKAARDAELQYIGGRFVLVGDLASLTDKQTAAVEDACSRKKAAA